MASFIEILNKLVDESPSAIDMQMVNGHVLEADRGTKKRTPHLKIAVREEAAQNYLMMKQKALGFLIHINHDEWKRANAEIDKNREEVTV